MAKGIYINSGEELEVINFKKIDEIILESDSEKISDSLTLYFSEEETGDIITINDTEYNLPAVLKIKGKPNQCLIDALVKSLESFETEETYINEDDFYDDDFEDKNYDDSYESDY